MDDQKAGPLGSNSADEICKRGRLFIISAPSGIGKTTLTRAVLERFSDMLYRI